MYSACMFCNRPLGENQVVEHFPIGRRLAFDADKGRLWVVCRKCERWNLTPMEERWEAIETCERIFLGTRVRVSTENIGLAKHPEGLELVRIGRPMRPEFAAWRYGDQFGRRRKRAILIGAGATALIGGVVLGGMAVGVGAGAFSQIGNFSSILTSRTLVKVRTDSGETIKQNVTDLKGFRLLPAAGGDGFRVEVRRRRLGLKKHVFEGEEARRIAGVVLPKINRMGAKKGIVKGAVAEIAQEGHAERFLGRVVSSGGQYTDRRGVPGYVNKMPKSTRLAVEMALHEEQERRAMEGELWLLERAWRAAEEIAGISDSLLLPDGTEEFLAEHGGKA